MKTVLFDIDGTLVTTRGAGREAFAHAVHEALGVSHPDAVAAIDTIDFRGGTDEVLLDRVTTALGLDIPRFHEPLIEAYLRVLERTMTPQRVSLLPGIAKLIDVLEARPGTIVGLLTGNIKEGARRKLRVVGIERLIDRPAGFAEDGRERPAIAKAALRRVESSGGSGARTIVIGDTQHDVNAARSIGARAVGVATGGTAADLLLRAQADLVVEDLSDFTGVLEMLESI